MVKQRDPLLYTYLKRYQEDPRSRVFAPLAEAYRKAGLVEEAIEIAREGLEIHPTFVGGKVALSRALFDQERYDEVLEVLEPVIRDVPDNLLAQRLVAESNLILKRHPEALNAYKMLLYFNPTDEKTAELVSDLENQVYNQGGVILEEEPSVEEFEVRPATDAIGDSPRVKRAEWSKRIRVLQNLLMRVERYRISFPSQ